MGRRGHALIFGGGNVGLMNVMAREILAVGGRVIVRRTVSGCRRVGGTQRQADDHGQVRLSTQIVSDVVVG